MRNVFVKYLARNKSVVSRPFSSLLDSSSTIYSDEHRSIQDSLSKLIDSEINPFVDEWEKAKIFPAKKIMKLLGNAGFLGVDKPIEYSGMGLDYTYNIAVSEQMGSIRCGGVSMAIGVQLSMVTPALISFGSEKLKKQFLEPTITGDIVASIGVSEPGGGSDVAAIRTNATKDGDDYVINGEKMWITNGTQADWICLLVNTEVDEKNKYYNKSLFTVPLNLPGISKTKINKMGMASSDTAHIFFDNVRVPSSYIIGKPGQGFIYQMKQFQEERLTGIAMSILPLESVIKETLNYASERLMYGKPLLNNQVVMFSLAELLTELECTRSLLYRAVHSYTFESVDVTTMASMGKLKIGRLSRQICDLCLQYWGGMGYTPDTYVNRMFRDFRLLSIGGGADEVMLGIISKSMIRKLK